MIGRIARIWVPLAFVTTVTFFAMYFGVQQTWRMGADQLPVRLAGDAAVALAAGAPPDSIVGTPAVDVSLSLAPWIVVYDRNGDPVASGATLDGRPAQVPQGVFKSADSSGDRGDRVTWQPRAGVRQAIAVQAVRGGPGGYVAAGQSMREVEAQIDVFGLAFLLAWLAAVSGSLVLVVLLEWWVRRPKAAT
jgi:hypothetical protein